MFLETELSGKLNNELESAGISVSEELIARTLAAVQAARTTEDSETTDAEWSEASEENINKLIELAGARKRRFKGIAPVLFRVATVMAACFVLVVGGFALRFSTMRMGKEESAPMAMDENGSTSKNFAYSTESDGTVEGEDFKFFGDASESQEEKSAAVALNPAVAPVESIVPTAEDNMADAVAEDEEETVTTGEGVVASAVQEDINLLTKQLAQAESVEKELTAGGTTVYRFVVRDAAGAAICYLVHETGAVEFAEMMADGETGAVLPYESSQGNEFRQALLVWLKEHGY